MLTLSAWARSDGTANLHLIATSACAVAKSFVAATSLGKVGAQNWTDAVTRNRLGRAEGKRAYVRKAAYWMRLKRLVRGHVYTKFSVALN